MSLLPPGFLLPATQGDFPFHHHLSLAFSGVEARIECKYFCDKLVVVKVLDWDPEGWWFKPRCSHDKIRS